MTEDLSVVWGRRVLDASNNGEWSTIWYCSEGTSWRWSNNKADATPMELAAAVAMMYAVELKCCKQRFVFEFVS